MPRLRVLQTAGCLKGLSPYSRLEGEIQCLSDSSETYKIVVNFLRSRNNHQRFQEYFLLLEGEVRES